MKTPKIKNYKPKFKIKNILKEVMDSFKEHRVSTDEYLFEDRHQWLKDRFNQGHFDFPDEYDYDTNTNSVGIMLAQIERYGGVVIDTKHGTLPNEDFPINTDYHLTENNLMNEIDSEKVGNAFGMFCLSRMKDDELLNNLKEFKSMFHEEILQVNTNRIKKSAPNDEITQQSKEIESERDVESVVNRTHDDLTKMVMNMKLDSGSWKKSLRKIGVIQ